MVARGVCDGKAMAGKGDGGAVGIVGADENGSDEDTRVV